MKEMLERLHKSVANMIGATDPDAPVEMTPEQFVVYVEAQITKAADDGTNEVRVARLHHLLQQVDAVSKNFEGPTPGTAPVQQFKDPGQQATTSTDKKPTNATPSDQHSSNGTQPAVAGGVGNTPPGGKMPPMTAGSSGFETPANATFAKSMEAVNEKLAILLKTMEPAAPESKDETKGDKPEDKPADAVAKSEASINDFEMWPMDMNTSEEKSKDAATDDLGWGFDPGSKMAEIAKADKKPVESDKAAE